MTVRFFNFTDGQNVKLTAERGGYSVIEYQSDMSVNPYEAQLVYFASKMNVRRRQLICHLDRFPSHCVSMQAGAMQWMSGDVQPKTGIRGAGDFARKLVRGSVTGESAIKPEYEGTGIVTLEPTYKFILLEDVTDWNGGIIIEDGAYLSSDASLTHRAEMIPRPSAAIAGGEGIFNLGLYGNGLVALESSVPREELIIADLYDDVIKIDGSLAIAWSPTLQFTVERTTKSLIGSAASGEGLVNVYRGTGRIMFAPVATGHVSGASTGA